MGEFHFFLAQFQQDTQTWKTELKFSELVVSWENNLKTPSQAECCSACPFPQVRILQDKQALTEPWAISFLSKG